MNFFCAVLGHTWVPGADNPKTAWNNDGDGQILFAKPASAVTFFEECVRCRTRRTVTPRKPAGERAAGSAE